MHDSLLRADDPRARAICETIGFGHALAHHADFHQLRHVLILDRATSGAGGEIILERARAVLDTEFPELSARLSPHTPDENNKRHGQAVAAASLPKL